MTSTSYSTSTSSHTSLFPGYKQVDEFGPDDDYEDELEECYVTLDLGSVDQTLVPSSSSYRLIGLDTPTPFLQLSGTIMKGHYRTLIGTELIFKDVSEETDPDSQSNVQCFTKTDRRIVFREVELKPKADQPVASLASTLQSRNKKYTSPVNTSDVDAPPSSTPKEGELRDLTSQNTRITVEVEGPSMQIDDRALAPEASESRDELHPVAGASQDQSMDIDT